MLGAAQDLQEIFPKAVVDADVNRQVYSSGDLITNLKNQNMLKDTVVIGLGTNGDFTDQAFADLMTIIGNKQVYWVNVYAPSLRIQGVVNDTLTKQAQKYKNLTIIDWYTYASTNNDGTWFYDDQVHLTPTGRIGYTKMILEALLSASN